MSPTIQYPRLDDDLQGVWKEDLEANAAFYNGFTHDKFRSITVNGGIINKTQKMTFENISVFSIQLHCQVGNNNIQFYRKPVEILKKIMQSQQKTISETFI